MALTRSALREKGITEKEVLDYVMEEHGNTVEAAKEKAKETAEAAAKITIDRLQAKVDSLPESDGEDWKTKYDAEVIAHKATKDGHAAEKDGEETTALIRAALAADGANPKAVDLLLKAVDSTAVKKKDGKLENWADVLKPVKEQYADFFGEVKTVGADVANPPLGGNKSTGHKDMNAWIRGTTE